MTREPSKGEQVDAPAGAKELPEVDPAVRARLEKIRREKRGRVRWNLSRHTAERAMIAISDTAPRGEHRPSSKSRRRKRHKRLL